MGWLLAWSTDAARFMSNLEKKEAQRIIHKLEAASKNPHHYFERLQGHEDFKLRVGDYRIIALLLHSEKTIFVEKIGHRKNIYQH